MVLMRNLCEKKAAVTRLGGYSSGKAVYVSTGADVRGYLRPIETTQSIVNLGIMGQAYEFQTNGYQDIQIKDTLTIESVEYRVMGISRETAGALDTLILTLELSVKN